MALETAVVAMGLISLAAIGGMVHIVRRYKGAPAAGKKKDGAPGPGQPDAEGAR